MQLSIKQLSVAALIAAIVMLTSATLMVSLVGGGGRSRAAAEQQLAGWGLPSTVQQMILDWSDTTSNETSDVHSVSISSGSASSRSDVDGVESRSKGLHGKKGRARPTGDPAGGPAPATSDEELPAVLALDAQELMGNDALRVDPVTMKMDAATGKLLDRERRYQQRQEEQQQKPSTSAADASSQQSNPSQRTPTAAIPWDAAAYGAMPFNPHAMNYSAYWYLANISHRPLYPPRLSAYRHTYGNCKSPKRHDISYTRTNTTGRGDRFTRLWPHLPDRRMEFETEHERCHAVMIRQLAVIVSILEHYNYTNWFVSHSTLLGAMRHGGFIPWDVDVDLVMTRSTTKFLRRYWRREFPRDMFLQSERTDSNFHMWIGNDRGARVKDRYSGFQGYNWMTTRKGKKIKQPRFQFGAGVDIIPIVRIKGSRQKVKVFHNYFNMSDVFPTTKVCFENIQVRAPRDPEWFLELIYGKNWRQTPDDAIYAAPTALPCVSTAAVSGSKWNLEWEKDHAGMNVSMVYPRYDAQAYGHSDKLFPRSDPHGTARNDDKYPYMNYFPDGRPKFGEVPNDSSDEVTEK